MTPEFKDKLGNLIAVGDFVAYPWRQSSSCGLTIARVIELRSDGQLKVIGLGWNGKKQRAGTVSRLDRVIVLCDSTIPDAIKQELGA
jgi:hypothetical protein